MSAPDPATDPASAPRPRAAPARHAFGRRDPRIVEVDQFRMEVLPDGHIVVIHNEDRPGVVGTIGTTLDSAGVNIARMQLGLDKDLPARAEVMRRGDIGPPGPRASTAETEPGE